MGHFQVVFLGGGPGGYIGALRASQLGLSVALIEDIGLGGTCLHRGCIPTKSLCKSAKLWREMLYAEEFGLHLGQMSIDFIQVMNRKENVVNSLVTGIEHLLKQAKVTVIKGVGNFKELGRIDVQTKTGVATVTADNIVVSTGSVPARPLIPGSDLPGVLTSDDILKESALPQRLVIIGGGIIGLEFASIYHSFGVKVTIIETLPTLLPNMDEEVVRRLILLLKRTGIEILTNAKVKAIRQGAPLTVAVESGSGTKDIPADRVLVATGRRPNLRGIDTAALGLKTTDRGALAVNNQMQTNIPNVYAIGDVIGGIMLAHAASAEGIIAAENIAGNSLAMNYRAIPSVIFTTCEIAGVGVTEQEVKNTGAQYKVSKFPFSANGKAAADGETIGIVKIIANKEGIIIGASIMGRHASSLIQELVIAVDKKMSGNDLAHIVHAHPTLSEAVMEAAYGLREPLIYSSPRQ